MKILNISFILFIISSIIAFSQDDNYYITGTKEKEFDTLAYRTAERIVKETAGLMEKEISPEEYILGPNDVLTLYYLSTKSKQIDLTITPEGKLFIPEIGVVDLKNKTLAEAKELIFQKVNNSIKATDIFVGLKELRKFKVSVSGAIQKSSIVSATAVDRVSEIIDKAGGLKPNASVRKIILLQNDGKTYKKVDLLKYFFLGDKNANPYVLGGDQIIIPTRNENEVISIFGEIPSPGDYEYTDTDSLSTLIRFGKGFYNTSFLDSVELFRFDENKGFVSIYLDLNSWVGIINSNENLPGDIALKPGDRVIIKRRPDWIENKYATITGEVLYPGKYAIDGLTTRVSDILEKAGGVTENANVESASLIRYSEKESEDKEMERLKRIPYNELSQNELRYFQARAAEIKGIMAIDFKKILTDKESPDNIVLFHQDSIHIPYTKYFVNVQGRVNNPGLVNFKPQMDYEYYISLAGGYGFRADPDETIIVKAKGQQYLAKDRNYKIEPGDNILVPPQSETTFWQIFTTALTIVTQLVTVAGVVLAIMRF